MVTLPSGRMAVIDHFAWPERPWALEPAGGAFIIAREKRGRAGELEVYRAGGMNALVLDRVDAEALCVELNATVSPRAAVRAPPGFRSGWTPKSTG